MIRIRYDREGDEHTLTASGHAGAESYGRDIVCAAVSALVYTLAQAMGDAEEDGRLTEFSYTLDSGDAVIRATPADFAQESVDAAVETVVTGLRMIAERYPEFVRMDEQSGGTEWPRTL